MTIILSNLNRFRKIKIGEYLAKLQVASSSGRSTRAPSNTDVMVPWALRVHTQTASRLVQSFFVGLTLVTNKHTDRPRYMSINRPHPVLCNTMRPKRYFVAPHPARRSIWPTFVRSQIRTFSCYFANFQYKRRLKLFAASLTAYFDY